MDILITGVTGKVGSELLSRFSNRKDVNITAFVMPNDKNAEKIKASNIDIRECLIEDYDSVKSNFKDFDYIFHLAAIMGLNPTYNNKNFLEVNSLGTFNLLDNAIHNSTKLKRFIYTSTGEVYPNFLNKYSPLDEFHPKNFYHSYGLSKSIAEDICLFYCRAYNIPVAIPRFTMVMNFKEVLDPKNTRFFLNARISSFKNIIDSKRDLYYFKIKDVEKSLKNLEKISGNEDRLLISCNSEGKPYEMCICDVRDIVDGLILMQKNDSSVGEIINIGPSSSFKFDIIIKYMSKKIGMPFISANLYTQDFQYSTNISKARCKLGYAPKYTIFDMIDESYEYWKKLKIYS
jgi:UDP-glucose 4-epimerase